MDATTEVINHTEGLRPPYSPTRVRLRAKRSDGTPPVPWRRRALVRQRLWFVKPLLLTAVAIDEAIGLSQCRGGAGEGLEQRLQLWKPTPLCILAGGFQPGVDRHELSFFSQSSRGPTPARSRSAASRASLGPRALQKVRVPRTVIGTVMK